MLNLSSQAQRFYHLGMAKICRSTFSDANNNRPYQIYESLFYLLLDRYATSIKGGNRKLKSKLYSIDATVVGLCMSLFGWAKFRSTKAGIKLHVAVGDSFVADECPLPLDACPEKCRRGPMGRLQRAA